MRKEQFDDYINNDLAWRKMEISQLFRILNDSENKDVVSKSMVLLLYAHWEGFIKKSSKQYLKYVKEKKVKLKFLTMNFSAITLKNFAKQCIDNEGLTLAKELQFINKQQKMQEKKFDVVLDVENDLDEDIINTKHNLNSKVLKNISEIVGIKYNDAMKSRTYFIDAILLNNRNSIGHAGKTAKMDDESESILNFDTVVELKDFVIMMLDYYAQILQDYVEEEFFLVSNDEKRELYEEEQEDKLTSKLERLGRSKPHITLNLEG